MPSFYHVRYPGHGIWCGFSNDITIENNKIRHNGYGIALQNGPGNTAIIRDNNIVSNDIGIGFYRARENHRWIANWDSFGTLAGNASIYRNNIHDNRIGVQLGRIVTAVRDMIEQGGIVDLGGSSLGSTGRNVAGERGPSGVYCY